jgi:YD repeat-containing protein
VRQFTRSGFGEVASERSYGGDDFDGSGTQNVGSPAEGAVCTAALPQVPLYRIDYEYTAGVLKRAAYASPALVTLDRTIDPFSGLVTADRDAAGIGTAYDYEPDTARLKEIDPPGDAKITLTYTKGSSASSGPKVDVVTTAGSLTLQKEHVAFDGLGRPRRESRWLPAETSPSAAARWITTESKYDGLGRKRSVSVPTATTGVTPPSAGFAPSVKVTTSEYDASGRPTRIVAPDGSVVRTAWSGNRLAHRTSTVAAANGVESSVEVIERYDGEGRLVSLTEGSGPPTSADPQGSPVDTSYAYDAGGRLKSVDAGEPHERLFTYDRRGFLTSEDHPESGVTAYLYDARGHARKRTSGGRTLSFTFDGAERLTTVAEGSNVMKELTFGSANSGTNMLKGKLLSARRRNVLSTDTYDVTETYAYDTTPAFPRSPNPAALMSQRTTLVEQVNGSIRTQLQTFTYVVDYDSLGSPKSVVMPSCSLHGCSAANGLATVDFTRAGGLLTSIANFATLTYHPSGMVDNVTHTSTSVPAPVDTYSAVNGLARPSAIQFTGGTCPTPNPSSIVSASSVCANSAGNSASVTPRPNITHAWQIAGGGVINSPVVGDSITYTAPASGTVTLTVTATDSCGGSASSSKSINVSTAPAAPVISVESPLCSGAVGAASVQPVTGVTYSWTITDGAITFVSGHEIQFMASGSSVTLHVSAANNCGTAAVVSKTAAVIAAPVAQLTTADMTIVRGGGSAVLSVSLSGASPRTIVWSDGFQQSNISASTITRSVSPDVTTEYALATVTAGGCPGSVSGTTTVTVIPAGPSSVTATTQENRNVLVTWTPVSGAASYRIERAPRVGAAATWSFVTGSASYLDTVPASVAPVTYIYYVRTVASDGALSNRGAWDYATAATLLNQRPQLVVSSTTIMAVDVTELRAGVDALRAAVSLQPSFGGATPLAGAFVHAADFTHVITAMNAARAAMSRPPFAYTGVAGPAVGGVPLAAHVIQIREALR